ncbi:MAG: hypothetical protein RhofKO_12950 [Rhodothermales bacterium]
MKPLLLLIALLFCAQLGQAQQVGTCKLGSATTDLDVGNVRAALYNGGTFFSGARGHSGYEVPKDEGISAIFSAGLWIAGLTSDGSLRFAGTAYAPWEYWPGPLDANGNPPTDCDDYDRMYSVYAADIQAYEREGLLAPDLRDWPHHLGAPVIDGDGIEGNYNLAGGDRPHIYGEQSAWWVMNDAGNQKEDSLTPPIGVEVQVQAFASSCFPIGGTRVPALDRTASHSTFYHFKVIHKGDDPLLDTYIGWTTDTDLGNASDDFVASDTTLKMMYYYNALETDRDYGNRPPAIGYLLADGVRIPGPSRSGGAPQDQRLPFTNTMMYDFGGSYRGAENQYGYMRSQWPSNFSERSLTLGDYGWSGTVPTRYSFPGDPVTGAFWSEENADGQGTRNLLNDRVMLGSSGPFGFAPGDTTDFTLAIVWARGEDRLGSIEALRGAASLAPSMADSLMVYDPYTCGLSSPQDPILPEASGYYILQQNYPEPFSQQTTIRYEVIDTVPVQLTIYDLLGRRVRTLVDGVQDAGVYDVVFEAGDLPTGTYFYRLEAAGYVSITRRMVLQR